MQHTLLEEIKYQEREIKMSEGPNTINNVGYNDLDAERNGKVDLSAGGADIDLSNLSGILRVGGVMFNFFYYGSYP